MNNNYYQYYIGLTTTEGAFIPEQTALEALQRVFDTRGIDGATLVPAIGWWKGEQERTLLLLCETDTPEALAEDIARALQQECVAFSAHTKLVMVYPQH